MADGGKLYYNVVRSNCIDATRRTKIADSDFK